MMMCSLGVMGLVLLDGQPELPAMNPEMSILHQVVRNGIAKGVGHLPVDELHPIVSQDGEAASGGEVDQRNGFSEVTMLDLNIAVV